MIRLLKMMSLCISFGLYIVFSVTIAYGGWESINPPYVSTDWDLSSIHFTSPNEGWAVGTDYSAVGPDYSNEWKGVLLHYFNGNWTAIYPPYVSSNWNLNSVHFTSPNKGWAVGSDDSDDNGSKGVLLHYLNGNWTAIYPPYVSSDWHLFSVHFTSPSEGWAVGMDDSIGRKGVLLHYLNGNWTAIYPPYVSSNWNLNSVHFTSPNKGWAVGSDDSIGNGVLLHYLNGNWTAIYPPYVISNCDLSSIHFTSPSEGWAVGTDYLFNGWKGVLLHYLNGNWTAIDPPYVSSDWVLYTVHLTSPSEGWAVGDDYSSDDNDFKGVLLHYLNGNWTAINPPYVSTDWDLSSIHFTSPSEGWAVGNNLEEGKGVLLRYFDEAISTPSLIGSNSGIPGTSYVYSAGGSASTAGHEIEYQFEWGDGTNSGWLLVGVTSVSKSWASPGTYDVKVQARCYIHTSVLSFFSEPLTVTISTPSIHLQSPIHDALFNSYSLISTYQPKFSWSQIGDFTAFSILFSTSNTDFSTRGTLITRANIRGTASSWTPSIGLWKKIMTLSNNNGSIRDIYWKIAGKSRDKIVFDSEVRSFHIEDPQAVTINSPQDGASFSAPPDFEFSSNGNIKFKLEVSSQSGFEDPRKIRKFTFTTKNPNVEQVIHRNLTSSQWNSVKNLIGTTTGYFRIRVLDGINRETVSEARSFTIQETPK